VPVDLNIFYKFCYHPARRKGKLSTYVNSHSTENAQKKQGFFGMCSVCFVGMAGEEKEGGKLSSRMLARLHSPILREKEHRLGQ